MRKDGLKIRIRIDFGRSFRIDFMHKNNGKTLSL